MDMARTRKGRAVSGWVVVDKPAGITSTAVVGKVRWAFGARKAGHAGTLDPAATGVLAVALGEATKTVPFVTDALKAYRFTLRWGQETETDDAEGRVTAESAARPEEGEVKAALSAFVGETMQIPPAYSAVKVDGERAYDLARAGAAPDLAARPLWVEELVLVDLPDADHAVFEMVCGKGGYVRALARDLGRRLGCLAHVVALRRIWSGPFRAEHAVSPEELERLAGTPEIDRHLMPTEAGLADLPEATCPEASVLRLRHGNPAPVFAPRDVAFGDTIWASHAGRAIALGQFRGGVLHPTRVFAEEASRA
jgi:tRNA pseudouridine55 synthase